MTNEINYNALIQSLLSAFDEDPTWNMLTSQAFAEQRTEARDEGDSERLAELDAWGVTGYGFTGSLAAREIIAALREMCEDGFTLPDEAHEWYEKLDEMITENSADAVASMALFLDVSSAPAMDATDFGRAFQDSYRGAWDKPGDWARSEASQRAEMGHETPQEVHAAENELSKWVGFINWDDVADSDFSEGFTLVELNGRTYVFEDVS